MSGARVRSYWGWGFEDAQPTADEIARTVKRFGPILGRRADEVKARTPRPLDEVDFPAPRIAAPANAELAALVSAERRDRAAHAYGRSFADVLRGFCGDYPHPPDLVARPRDERELLALLEWCSDQRVAAIPYGGGSSVVGGVEADVGDAYAGAMCIDLGAFDRLLEVDQRSRAARIQAGILGPALEDALRPHDLTLRHFPQSFELSSLGGWIATRAGGHFATLHTHIDDFVESLRVVTPRGTLETRRLPGSGAGPSPDRMFIGSEGTLGIITEAWMRLQARPRFRAKASAAFTRFDDAVEATRAVAQSGLYPANCRLLDGGEAFASRASKDGSSVLLLAFESADHDVAPLLARAVEIARAHGGRVEIAEGAQGAAREEDGAAAKAWRETFLRAPYLLNTAVAIGVVADTFETAITWDRFADFHEHVTRAVGKALGEVAGGGFVMCRFTHVYPDGPAPYYTFVAPAPEGAQLDVWRAAKQAAGEAVVSAGGTITHHHAVGRLHKPYYEKQRPELFADALRAAKAALDPQGILNPGVLL
ncbi:MAG: FAD-binding oxidoreductase [Myxococcales bacterium]|nr:FAD-binding oxidoreductase [Myxococcales bacterium]